MRIVGTPSSPSVAPTRVAEVESHEAVAAKASPGATATAGALQSAVLQPALAALREMPDIDLDRVAALRDALAKGEVPFDAAKLAGLIERFHGRKA